MFLQGHDYFWIQQMNKQRVVSVYVKPKKSKEASTCRAAFSSFSTNSFYYFPPTSLQHIDPRDLSWADLTKYTQEAESGSQTRNTKSTKEKALLPSSGFQVSCLERPFPYGLYPAGDSQEHSFHIMLIGHARHEYRLCPKGTQYAPSTARNRGISAVVQGNFVKMANLPTILLLGILRAPEK